MRKDAVLNLMVKSNGTTLILDQLIENEMIEKVTFNDQDFFLRKFSHII